MNSFIGFSPSFALLNYNRTGHKIYLNISKTRIPKKQKVFNQIKFQSHLIIVKS